MNALSNEIPDFDFEGAKIRTVMQGEMPWFNADDVCKALGYLNTPQTVVDHVDEEDVMKRNTLIDRCDVSNGYITSKSKARKSQMMTYVNESGLYALIFGSGKPKAKRFKRWVTSEVLPAIRKTGGYRNDIVLPVLKTEQQYQMAGPYELSPTFFIRLYYALDKSGSAAALLFHLLRMGALNQWVEASLREISKEMGLSVSRTCLSKQSKGLMEQGILDLVNAPRRLTRYKVDQATLDLFILRVPEMCDKRPGLAYSTQQLPILH